MSNESIAGLVDLLKTLAHPVRLRILALLREGELCVCQVTEILGFAPSTISEHLSLLRRAGLVEERKEAKWVFYTLADDPALGPLFAALWPLLEGDGAIRSDARHGSVVRRMPIVSLYKAANGVAVDPPAANIAVPALPRPPG